MHMLTKQLMATTTLARYLRRQYHSLSTDDRGAEIVEWVVVVMLLIVVGVLIYNGILMSQLAAAINAVGQRLVEAASGS